MPCGGRPWEVLSPMRGTVYFLVLTLPFSSSLLKAQMPLSPLPGATVTRHYMPPPPGLLESFLKANPSATVFRHNLGGLSAPGGASAKFIAVVASDSSQAGHEAEGIEVVLTDGKRKRTVYLDYDPHPDGHSDSLGDLARNLTFLADGPGKDLCSQQSALQGSTENGQLDFHGVTTAALNRAGSSPVWCCPRFTCLDLGVYRSGTTAGVIISAPGAEPVSCQFPGASLDEVVKIIQAGRTFVLEH